MKNLIFVSLIFVGISIKAQKIATAQAKEDLIFLKEGIKTYNPSLHAYNPKFDQKTDQFLDQVQEDSISLLDYFTHVSRICALSNEGHFLLGNWSDTVHSGFGQSRYKYLPISFEIESNNIYVWNDFSNEQALVRGVEVISINNLTTEQILQQLRNVTPSDGEILTYADKQIELGFSWKYYLYIDQSDKLDLKARFTDGTQKTVTVKALSIKSQRENYKKFVASKTENQPKTEVDSFYELNHEGEIAFLKLPSFDYKRVEKYEMDAKKMYKSIFEELNDRGTRHLVIDLRGNTGGRYKFSDEMIPYIMKDNTSNTYLKKSISWEGKTKTRKLPKPAKNVFQGNILVLVDGLTFSAGSTLTRHLKEYGNAVIIGEETGSRYEGFSAGSTQYITLPNTKVQIGIPRYWSQYPESSKQKTTNRGVLPDHEIRYTIEDIMKDTDLHMKKCRSLIDE